MPGFPMYAAAEIADRVRPYTHQHHHHHQLASSFSLGLDDHRHLRSLVWSSLSRHARKARLLGRPLANTREGTKQRTRALLIFAHVG